MDLLETRERDKRGIPLAELLRPSSLDEVAGQEHLLAKDAAFRKALENGVLGSFILWGPPGTGKTTLVLLVSRYTGMRFVRFSAVTGGVREVRNVVARAMEEKRTGRETLFFVDEIHRFNKAQQDAFLPHVENGTITLAGATTENPSFALTAPLLSRCAVYVLERLGDEHLVSILERAVKHPVFVEMNPRGIPGAVLERIAAVSDGDGRRALNILEMLAGTAAGSPVTVEMLNDLLKNTPLVYDRQGEEHYNLISAFHKSLRSGDADASLYWLARMILSGENPLYIARRMIRFATEDVGLADPSALTVAMRAADSWRFLGSPEGDLALAEAACYLALAPKSNSIYVAWKKALGTARDGSLPVPLHLRNSPTGLMRRLGYGKGYQYAHDMPGNVVMHKNFPDKMGEPEFYVPGDSGRERELSKRLHRWKEARRRARKASEGADGNK